MSYVVYILKSEKDQSLYIGKTNNLDRRFKEHNRGKTSSIKAKLPYVLLECHPCANEPEARKLEKEFKKGFRREELRKKYNLRRSAGAVNGTVC